MVDKITKFRDNYYFLSNFYPCEILWEGKVWKTAEHIYQAAKTEDIFARERIRKAATPGIAKRLGRTIRVRSGWEEDKNDLMYQVVLQKFKQHKDLRKRLFATGDAELIEGNEWGDTYWGMYRGMGENRLGKILMRVREEIRNGNK